MLIQKAFFSYGRIALNSIIYDIKKKNKKEKLTAYLPRYICSDVYLKFLENDIDIIYYELNNNLNALIDENMPTIVIATNKINYDKIFSNIQEIKSRKGKIFAIVSKGDKEVKEIADYVIEVPDSIESITPFITVIPLQLLSYHIAVMLGKDVDQPRNLAKSVTVE